MFKVKNKTVKYQPTVELFCENTYWVIWLDWGYYFIINSSNKKEIKMNLYYVGNTIRKLRKKVGLTQEELAEKIDISPQAISKWENGRCLPETQVLPKLAKLLNTTIDDLLTSSSDEVNKKNLETQKSVLIEPKIIRKGEIILAGVIGNGSQTGEIWDEYMRLESQNPISNKKENCGYELRMYNEDNECECLVGVRITSEIENSPYHCIRLPDVLYAVFEIYPAKGYESQNEAMDKWLSANQNKYEEFTLDKKHYAIEYYDERFKGNEDADSIVEIWIPILKL